jgi:hypothetical protein
VSNINRDGLLVAQDRVTELVRSDEATRRIAATGTDGAAVDKSRMIRNRESEG